MEKYEGIILDRFCDDIRCMDVYGDNKLISRADWNIKEFPVIDGPKPTLHVIFEDGTDSRYVGKAAIDFICSCEYRSE